MRRRSFRGAVTIMAVTTAALIGTAGAAFACHGSDDGRGNPIPGNAPVCKELGEKAGGTLTKVEANTGFNNMWLVWVGGLLLLAGGGILGFLKFRRKATN